MREPLAQPCGKEAGAGRGVTLCVAVNQEEVAAGRPSPRCGSKLPWVLRSELQRQQKPPDGGPAAAGGGDSGIQARPGRVHVPSLLAYSVGRTEPRGRPWLCERPGKAAELSHEGKEKLATLVGVAFKTLPHWTQPTFLSHLPGVRLHSKV